MGFRQGAYAKIWSVKNEGNYSTCNLSISKKNKDTNNYEVEFQDGFIRLVGAAHNEISKMNIPEKGLSVKISSCDVTNHYDTEKKKLYTNYVIFGFEDPNANNNSSKPANAAKGSKSVKPVTESAELDDEDDDLPF